MKNILEKFDIPTRIILIELTISTCLFLVIKSI